MDTSEQSLSYPFTSQPTSPQLPTLSSTFISSPTKPTPSPSQTPQTTDCDQSHNTGIPDLEQEIREMKQAFESLVDSTEDAILKKKDPLRHLQRSIKHIPASLKLPLGEYFRELTHSIFRAKSVEELFALLSDCWDYLNPGLFTFFVGRFGSPDNIAAMNAYLNKLDKFRTRVRLEDYLRIQQHTTVRNSSELIFRQLTMVMNEDEWKKKTLQDVENFKIELSQECCIQSFLPKIHAMAHSIALVFTIPLWIPIDWNKLEPFFLNKGVIEVCLNNYLFESDGAKAICDALSSRLQKNAKPTCSLCNSLYTNPKLLQCFHIYCHNCLTKIVMHDRFIVCPSCHHPTTVANSVSELPSADQFVSPLSITPEDDIDFDYCSEHAGKKLELYCKTCGVLICFKCCKEHYSHDYQPQSKPLKMSKNIFIESLKPLQKQLGSATDTLMQIMERRSAILLRKKSIEGRIQEVTTKALEYLEEAKTNIDKQLHAIQSRKTELFSQLQQLTEDKLDSLDAQRDLLKTVRAHLSESLLFMERSVNRCNEEEVLKVYTYVNEKTKRLISAFEQKLLKLHVKDDILFVASDVHLRLGVVCSPSTFSTTLMSNHLAEVGKEFSANFYSIGKSMDEILEVLQCTLVSDITDATLQVAIIKGLDQDQYQINFQPTVKGWHHLYIKIEGQDIGLSPFTVAVKTVEKRPTSFSQILSISIPKSIIDGVTISENGDIIVAHRNLEVSVYSSKGVKKWSFNSGHGHCSVAVDSEYYILVAQHEHPYDIQKYTSHGMLVNSGRLRSVRPQGIAFNATNHKLYISDKNHTVHILNSDLTYYSTFGKKGINHEELESPKGIACDSSGNVCVVDNGNHRIQVFTAEGKFISCFGEYGDGEGQLLDPSGIAIDTNDNVYVSDRENGRVSVFTSVGQFVTCFTLASYCLKEQEYQDRVKWENNRYDISVRMDTRDISDKHLDMHLESLKIKHQSNLEQIKRYHEDRKSNFGIAVDICGVLYVCDGYIQLVHLY